MDLRLSLVDFANADMEWYRELVAVKEAFEQGQSMTRQVAETFKQEFGGS
jgi:hypothetical protein